MDTDQGILDEIEASLANGGTLDTVDSTDDQLLLVIAGAQTRESYRLDRAATRSLLEADLIDRLTRSTPSRPEPVVQG